MTLAISLKDSRKLWVNLFSLLVHGWVLLGSLGHIAAKNFDTVWLLKMWCIEVHCNCVYHYFCGGTNPHKIKQYRVTTGDRVLPSVHVQLLKTYTPREPKQTVKRVTSVLEPDTVVDSMDNQYAEAKVTGKVDNDSRVADIGRWESDFADTLTKEPGLTELVQFKIETSLHPPICQGPYNTPQALLGSVDKELAWLKE